jgi:hypothetical protein
MIFFKFLGYLLLTIWIIACGSTAHDVEEAQRKLLATDKWRIEEIRIDDAAILKNGKHIAHISGIVFDEYMDWVRFGKNGVFEGHFNYKPAGTTEKFQWIVYPKQKVIALRDTVNKTGGWNIYPRQVFDNRFEMEVYSTAYDPPRTTKVSLIFIK